LKIGFAIDSFRAVECGEEIIPHGGIGVYLQELLHALLSLESRNEYFLIRANPGPVPLKHPRVHAFVFPKTASHHAIRHSGLWRDWIVRKHRLDLMHEHHPDQPAFRMSRIPRIVTVHDLIPLIFPDKFPLRFRLIFKAYCRRNLREAEAIVCVSEHTRSDLLRYFPQWAGKSCVIPIAGQTLNRCGQPDAAPLSALGIRSPYLLNVSTIEPRKNHAALLEAFALLKGKGYGHQLVCVGALGWKTRPILDHPVLKTHAGDIVLLGQVERSVLKRLYEGAEAMVYPTLYEGFGLPPLEAMEFGTSVIASRNSSLPEILGDAACYVSATPDGRELAEAIEEILRNGARRKEMARLSRVQWRRYTWEQTARQTLRLYEAVASKRKKP